jgi:glucose-1-phosphate thymidylyltransferase
MAQVFISYSRKNVAFVERLAKDLQTAGMKVWYDVSDLEVGKRWATEIESAIQQSQYFIIILSRDSVKSEWVEIEFLSAKKYKLKIIPLLLQSCDLPMWCINLQYIDVQGKNYKLRFSDLKKALDIEQQEVTKDKVDCVILCGGYATRLWPLTIDISKVLLPIAGKPVLEYVIDFAQESGAVGKTILSINQKYVPQIQAYLDHYQSQKQLSHPIEIIVEPSTQQKEKLGPVGALQFIISRSTPRDLLVLGGDNIFGFRLDEFLNRILKSGETCSYNAAICEYQEQTQSNSELGWAEFDEVGNFIGFTEKPNESVYKNVSTACYFFHKRDVDAINEYIQTGGNADNLGEFIHWLSQIKKNPIKFIPFYSLWFDTGTRQALIQANTHFITHSIVKTNEMPNTERFEPVQIDPTSKASGSKPGLSKLGPNVYIGPGVQIQDSVIHDSIIMDHCVIKNSTIEYGVIGSGSVIEGGHIYEGVYGPKSRVAT